jgi:hypothetical protein
MNIKELKSYNCGGYSGVIGLYRGTCFIEHKKKWFISRIANGEIIYIGSQKEADNVYYKYVNNR